MSYPQKTTPSLHSRAAKTVVFYRLLLFFLIAAFMCWSPFYWQILGGRSPLFRRWTMFAEKGKDFYALQYRLRTPEGERPIDRYEALGLPHGPKAPLWFWRVHRKAHLIRISRRLCEAMGEGADVRLYARWSTKEGWRRVADGERNVCGP